MQHLRRVHPPCLFASSSSAGIATTPAAIAAKATKAISAAVAANAITTANGLTIGSSTTVAIVCDRTSGVSPSGRAALASASGIVTIAALPGATSAASAARVVTVAAVGSRRVPGSCNHAADLSAPCDSQETLVWSGAKPANVFQKVNHQER